MAAHPLVLRLVHQGAHLHAFAEGVTHLGCLGAGLYPGQEIGGQGFGDQHAAGGRAHLPGVEEGTAAGQFHGQLQVSVLQHQQRRLAAQLQAHALHGFRRALHHLHAHRVAAGEGDLGHLRVGRQRRAHRQAGAAHQVEHAGRQAAVVDDARQLQLRQRRHLGGLEHHGATGGQGRGEFPGGSHHGEVPRHDQPHHTDGLAAQTCGEVLAGQLHRTVLLGVQTFGEAGVVLEGADHVVHIDGRLEQRLAVVQRLQLDQGFATLAHTFGDTAQQCATLGAAAPGPGREGPAGSLHGLVDARRIAGADARQTRFGGRVDHLQGGAAGQPLAIDVHTGQGFGEGREGIRHCRGSMSGTEDSHSLHDRLEDHEWRSLSRPAVTLTRQKSSY
ncbi:hypothetical protein FQZ97_771090 [compost metagenome]